MSDQPAFWQTLADNPPVEAPSRDFEELPDKAFVLGQTASAENGKAAPGFEIIEKKDDPSITFLKFRLGLLAKGGDSHTNAEKNLNAMVWLDFFVRPGEKEDQGKPLSGRFTGFLNNLFAPGVEHEDKATRSRMRWAQTMKILQATAELRSLTLEQYGGDTAKYLAGLAATALLDAPRVVLFKTKLVTENWKTKEKLQKPRVEASFFEDATTVNMAKREVKMFETENGAAGAAAYPF